MFGRLINILIFLFLSQLLAAQNIAPKQAYTAASNFVATLKDFSGYKTIENVDSLKDSTGTLVGYLVKLYPQGFVILPSDKEKFPITGFSSEGFLDTLVEHNDFFYSLVISDLSCEQTKSQPEVEYNVAYWDKLLKGIYPQTETQRKDTVLYGPWIPSVWGGVNCYDDQGNVIYPGNYYTPNHYSPGCVATSLSQILYRYKWPEHGTSSHTDYDNTGSSQGVYYANFYTTYYDWDNMLDEYYHTSSTLTQQKACAKLQYHCGISVDMDYESDGSTSNVNRSPGALSAFWRYTGHYEDITWSNFWSRMNQNLENGHPVQMAIKADNGAGHAIAVDGYRQIDGGDKYYHLNMGWWGSCNAWYRINVSYNACGYTSVTGAVFDILPEPELSLGDIKRSCDERTFTLTWKMSKYVNWDAFELEQSTDGGTTWSVISSDIADTFYTITVNDNTVGKVYLYRVKAKYDGYWYYDSYSNVIGVPIRDQLTFLDFDGDDSFFIYDNSDDDLDVSNNWTIETWLKVRSYTDNTWSVIMDRRNVFSFYLINDADADYAVKFAVRDDNDAIIASVQSDNSQLNMSFNRWYHVAVSYDGSVARLFINGYQVASSTDPDFNLTASSKALNIAARYWSNGYERYLNGFLDEIRISDIARYRSDFVPDRYGRFEPDDDTRLLLHLDEGYGYDLYEQPDNFKFILLRSSPNSPNWAFEDYGTKWTGNVSQDWSNADNWSGGLPDESSLAIIPSGASSMPVISDDITILHLKMEDSTSLVVNFPYVLTVKGNVCNNGTLTLEAPDDSTASAMLLDNGIKGFGVFKAKKFFPGRQWTYLSIPVNNKQVSSKLLTDIDQENFNPNLIWYDETYTGSDWMLGWKAAYVDAQTPRDLEVMKGYAYYPDSDCSVYFSGTFNTGILRITTTYTLSDDTEEHEGWNFVGNPYPSSVDWDATEGWAKQNIDNSIYLWNGTNYSYYVGPGGNDLHTGIGVNGGSSIIPPMQGFFVKASADGYLEVNNNARVAITHDAYKKNILPYNTLKLSCYLGDKKDETAVRLASDAKDGYDKNTDALKIIVHSDSLPQLYSYDSSSGEKFAIASYPENLSKEVDLGIWAPVSGMYKLELTECSIDNYTVYLLDSYSDVRINLTENKEYKFYLEGEQEYRTRFKLVFDDNDDKENVDVRICSNANKVCVFVPADYKESSDVWVYDISGKIISHYKVGAGYYEFKIRNYSGIVVVVFKCEDREFDKKLLILQSDNK